MTITRCLIVGSIHIENDEEIKVFLKSLYIAEIFSAKKLKAMLSVSPKNFRVGDNEITEQILKTFAIKLSDEQIEILKDILSHKVSIITGGPGTGKTTLIKSISTIIENLGEEVLLAAPTGRAARRLSEITRHSAFTIHKLLEYNFKTNTFEESSRIFLPVRS